MRAVVQRVMNASVSVDGAVISSLARGLLVLVGVARDDTEREMDYIVRKVLNIRLFEGEEGRRWSKSVVDLQLPLLCVSQFTLYAVLKGNKPDYHQTMAGDQSRDFYQLFLTRLRQSHKSDLVKDGQFGALMQVSLQNDGPVTITLESADMGQDNRVKKPTNGARVQLVTASCPTNQNTAAAPHSENMPSVVEPTSSSCGDSATYSTAEHCEGNSGTLTDVVMGCVDTAAAATGDCSGSVSLAPV